ncbi:MAG: ABC transporter substrate-binding protein [Kangiellaceae bacterium]|jgi:phospholipid transport system substrate-binding protein|nr:ABC transporter substrate-binding protein [Kangiellaceae bacterium]
MNQIKKLALTLVLLVTTQSYASAEPKAMLVQAADNIISYLKSNKEAISKDESLAIKLVNTELLPYISQESMARRVLGKHWKSATSEQKKIFIDKFLGLVITTYAKGLAQYSGQTFEFEDTEYNTKKNGARVKSVMNQPEGEPIKIDYLFRKMKASGEWRVVDVSIEGASMAKTYRNQYAEQINKDGFEVFINKLKNDEIKM